MENSKSMHEANNIKNHGEASNNRPQESVRNKKFR
jgi:hypothetical protein